MARKLGKMTTDHEEIRKWAEERSGRPTEVIGTAREGQTGMIRIDFPGYSGEGSLRPISWDEWFRKFDESELALVYQEQTAGGETSHFNKLVARETAARREAPRSEAARVARQPSRGRGRARKSSGRTGGRTGGRASGRSRAGRATRERQR